MAATIEADAAGPTTWSARTAPSAHRRWDPFEGSVVDHRDAFVPSAVRWTTRRKLIGVVALAGLPVATFGHNLDMGWVTLIGFAMALGLGMLLAYELPASEEEGGGGPTLDRCRKACRQLAERHRWGVHLLEPPVDVTFSLRPGDAPVSPEDIAAVVPTYPGRPDRPLSARQLADLADTANTARLGDTHGKRTVSVLDPCAYPIHADLEPLLLPSAVTARPTVPIAVLHCETSESPAWAAIALSALDETNPRRSGPPRHATPGEPTGGTLTIVHALPLSGTDGLSALVRARSREVSASTSDLAFGGRFDAAFRTTLLEGDARDLSRVLTPELREALVAIHGTDMAEAMIHRGALFVRTITALSRSNDTATSLARRIEVELERTARRMI